MSNQIVKTFSVAGAKQLASWAKKNPWKSLGLALAFTAVCVVGYLVT